MIQWSLESLCVASRADLTAYMERYPASEVKSIIQEIGTASA
jgi:hypothetical protein